MTLSWQRRRVDLNHDWLKNKYLPALGKFQNLLHNYIEDEAYRDDFMSEILPEWEFHRVEARDLVKTFKLEMSPRVLIDDEPFSRLDDDVGIWLKELVHNLWLTRYPVTQWMEEAFRCINDVDEAYEKVIKVIKECPDIHSVIPLKPLRSLLEEYSNFCRKLAKAFEKFPSRILFT